MSVKVTKLLSALVLFSLVGCGGPESSREPELDTASAAVQGDVDDDGIADAEDNCPGRANEEQFDTDQDGQGDACDAFIIPFRPTQEGIRVKVGNDRSVRPLAVASVLNHTGQPASVTLASNATWLMVPQSVNLQAGAEFNLVAQLNPQGLPAGRHAARVSISLGGITRLIDIIIDIIDILPNGDCVWAVSLNRAKVTTGQAWPEGKLEVQVRGTMNLLSAYYPSGAGHQKMAVGTTHSLGPTLINTFVIPDNGSTVTLPVDLFINEDDSWATGADDLGSGQVFVDMKCGAPADIVTDTISIGGGGNVWVEVKAEQIH